MTSAKHMQITSSFATSKIWTWKALCLNLVKIGSCDVAWRHVTSYHCFWQKLLNKYWRKQKRSREGISNAFPSKGCQGFPTRGQWLFYDKWFKSYAWSNGQILVKIAFPLYRHIRLEKNVNCHNFGKNYLINFKFLQK